MSGVCKKLGELRNGDNGVTVLGVVRMFRTPSLVRTGRCYSCSMEIEDETLWHGGSTGRGITFVMFRKQLESCPRTCLPGDVVLLRKAHVVVFRDRLQGSLRDYSICAVFDGHVAAPVEPRDGPLSCGGGVSAVEIQRVKDLKEWAAQNLISSDDLSQTPGPSIPLELYPVQGDTLPRKINSLHDGDKCVTIAGVVRYFKPPTKCHGNSSYYVTLSVIDESFQPLTFTLFNTNKCSLPRLCSPGNLVLVRGLYIGVYDAQLQGKGFDRTSSLLTFLISQEVPLVPKEDKTLAVMPCEVERIKELRVWALVQVGLWPHGYTCPLEEVKAGNYFDLSCQVVAVIRNPREPEGTFVLTVWDGTLLELPCREADQSDCFVSFDPALRYKSCGLTKDFFVRGEEEVSVQPGDLVLLYNVHALSLCTLSQSQDSDGAFVKLLIGRDSHHAGAISILKADDKEAIELLAQFPLPPESMPVWRKFASPFPASLTIQLHPEEKRAASVHAILSRDDTPARYSTVIQVVRVISPQRAEDVVQLRCPSCKARASLEEPKFKPGDVCFLCARTTTVTPPQLQLMYVLALRVKDETGEMDVHISDHDGEIFFSDRPLANLFVDSRARETVLEQLFCLTGGNDPFFDIPEDFSLPRPKIKCCIMVYTSRASRLCYRIFDTILADCSLLH